MQQVLQDILAQRGRQVQVLLGLLVLLAQQEQQEQLDIRVLPGQQVQQVLQDILAQQVRRAPPVTKVVQELLVQFLVLRALQVLPGLQDI